MLGTVLRISLPVLPSVAAAIAAMNVALLATSAVAHAQGMDQAAPGNKRLIAVRAVAPIVIDGTLDEQDWQRAPVASQFVQNEPEEGAPASEDTEVRVLYDNTNLYIGVFAHDREPQRALVNDLKKDFSDLNTDAFEVVLDTFHDGRNGYIFAINPAGAKMDAQMINEGREINVNWDAVWDTQTRMAENGWYAEIAIPFKTLRFDSVDAQTWGVNFQRRIRRRNEDSFWAPLPRIYDLSRVSMAGTLEGLQGLRAGKDFRIKPYGLGSFGESAGQPSTRDRNAGFDVKYGLGSGLTWDFTVNTDFAQVEADEQQVNLGRISLFFPEKRDFFLENSGVFAFGAPRLTAGGGAAMTGGGGRADDSSRNDPVLFFSRRIGLSPGGGSLPILAGTRLTGRIGPYTVGALNIQQRADKGAPAGNFTALRLRRDVLATSDIGMMILNKDTSGQAYNRVAGFDANFRFFRNLNINNQISKTFSPAAALPGDGSTVYYRSSFDYRGNVWDFRGGYGSVGQRYNNEIGYVPRLGVRKATVFIAPHLRPKNRSGWLRESFPHFEFINVTRQDGRLESRYVDYHLPFNFNDGGFMELQVNRTTEGLSAPFLINSNRNITIPAGVYSFTDSALMVRTNPSAAFSYNIRYSLGNFYDGYKHTYQVGFTTRFNEQLNVAATFTRNAIALPAGVYATNLLTSRINFSFSTNVFLNALLQYNTDARMWTSNVRFNIIHRPLSDFFLVYNERRDSTTDNFIDRAVIAKVTYMMAF